MDITTQKTSSIRVAISFIILTILSWFVLRPLSQPGFFPMHDDTQVARVVVMSRAIAQGQFPVRWVSDLGYGYGYPIYNFYGPLPYYVGALFNQVGLSGLGATKVMFGIGIILLGWSTFALVTSFWGPIAGLTAAVFALFAPYHAVQIYIRGAVGEFWASAFIPFVLLGFLLVGSAKNRKLGVFVGSIGLSAVILSHTLTGFVAVGSSLVFLAAYIVGMFIKKIAWDKEQLLAYVAILITALGLTVFFWLPAFFEMRYTNVSGQISASANYRDHFVCLSQFWNSSWGYGGSVPGCIDGLSFKLGKVHILLGLVGLLLLIRSKKIRGKALYWTALLLVFGGIIFATSVSAPLWNLLPNLAYVQYPWRFITIIELGLAILVGRLVVQKSLLLSVVIATIVVTFAIWNNGYLFAPQYSYPRPDQAFETASEIRFRVSKISDEYLPVELVRPTQATDVVFGTIEATSGATLSKVQDDATAVVYRVSSAKSVDVRINKAYFPGWKYWANNKEIFPRVSQGLPTVTLPAGQTVLTLRFVDTPVRTIGNMLSLCFVIGLLLYYGKPKKTIA